MLLITSASSVMRRVLVFQTEDQTCQTNTGETLLWDEDPALPCLLGSTQHGSNKSEFLVMISKIMPPDIQSDLPDIRILQALAVPDLAILAGHYSLINS